MLKLLVKLALAAFIANAGWQVGAQYVVHYRFRDSVREAATWRNRSETELRRAIAEIGGLYDVPLTSDTLQIDRDGRHTVVTGRYVRPIEFLPGRPYEWPFSWTVEVYTAPTMNELIPEP